MKVSRKLHRDAQEAASLSQMYRKVLGTIERIVGTSGEPEPTLFGDSDQYAEKYLSYNLRRKSLYHNDISTTPKELKQAALTGFLDREKVNKYLNLFEDFGAYWADDGKLSFASDEIGMRILHDARDIIHDVLGSKCDPLIFANLGNFGGGASATLKRASATPGHKFLSGCSVTSELHDFAKLFVESCPVWADIVSPKDCIYISSTGRPVLPPGYLKRYLGAVTDYVSKDAKIDRMIFKEPELNGFFQKGMGSYIRKKLANYRKFTPDGMNISTSGDLNQWLAHAGSKYGHISTVDAERASDSLSLVLYEMLFPESWYEWFLRLRSPYSIIDGRVHKNELMSGMGNGFTFEAESLIFYAIGCAASKRSKLPNASIYVSVHGDDLTVPSDVFSDVCAAYAAAGIVVNKGKSFSEGPFRESCGGHYFNGHSVKPFYVKTQTGNQRGDWFWLTNSLHLWLLERTELYRTSHKCKDLEQVLAFLQWYSSNGKPQQWRVPYTRSRRSGIFSAPFVAKGKAWKSRQVKNKPVLQDQPCDAGLYLDSLRNPPQRATVYEMTRHKPPILETDHEYFTAQVIEYDGQVVFWDFPDIDTEILRTPLWSESFLHNGD